MKVTYAGRHFELTDALKAHIEQGLAKLEAHGEKITEVDVVLDVQKLDHIAEININANGNHAHSKETSGDMYQSVDAAISKLEKQLRKSRERRKNNKAAKRTGIALEEGADSVSVAGNGNTATEDVIVVHRETMVMRQMQANDAIREYELADADFIPFVNSETGRVNVLYKRDDGAYAVIEPTF